MEFKQGKSLRSEFKTKSISYAKSKKDTFVDKMIDLNNFPTTYYEIDRLSNFNSEYIPEKDNEILILTTRYINSTEILDVINRKFKIIKIYSLYNSINKIGLSALKKYDYEVLYVEKSSINKEDYNYNYKAQHLKLFLIECENGNFITVNGSANPSISSRNESFIVTNSKIKHNSLLDILKNNVVDNVKLILPKNNKLIYVNNKGLCLIDFVKSINKESKIQELSFVYFTAGKKFLNKLNDIIDEDTKINFFQALKIKSMLPDMYEKTKSMHSAYNGILKEEATHCKITLIKNKLSNYVFISTANFDSNSRLEMHEIEDNKEKYDYIFNFYNKFFK